MDSPDFETSPISWDKLAEHAVQLRKALNVENEPYFKVIHAIEVIMCNKLELIDFEVDDRATMGQAEGYTCPNGKFIRLREDVYIGAINNDGRSRFTAAHELGHWMLHTNGAKLSRIQPGKSVPAYRSAERQADQMAAELLMPRRFFSMEDTPQTVVDRHGVSFSAATHRLRFLERKGLLKK